MNKNFMRKDILNKRKALSQKEVMLKSNKISELLLSTDFYLKSHTIMTYIDFRNEVMTEKIIRESLETEKDIVIPISIVKTKDILLSQLLDFDKELTTGAYGILEPRQEYIREVKPESIDLVLVPGVAFDRRGSRIGYGGGYYDRFLKKLDKSIPKVALAFDMQLAEIVYRDNHDIPMDYIITENEIIHCVK